jgi:soluble lytic murein transglycosylase-like protein
LIRRVLAAVCVIGAMAVQSGAATAGDATGPLAGMAENWSPRLLAGYAAALDAYRAVLQVAPPGPVTAEPGDPKLTALITEASHRFDVPEPWIRAVMRVESDGDSGATSPQGAMGLMQVMPETYAYLSGRYNLGEDPYAQRDNVFAGSAYLREMYDRYGSAGFIAAYNAGPGRYEDYLCGRDLPEETKRYVASVRLALGEALFTRPASRFYEPIAISSGGELLLGHTGKPMPADDRLALHSLIARAVQRAAAE